MKRAFMKLDATLFFMTILLFVMGLIMVFSASTIESFMRYGTSPYYFFIKQSIFLIIGFVAFLFIINFPLKMYYKYVWPMVYALIILLFCLFVYGQAINNSISWIRIGNLFSIQPSEFAKTGIILFMACFYYQNSKNLDKYIVAFTPPVIALIIFALVLFQPDFGTAVVFAIIVLFTFFSIPIDKLIKKQVIQIMAGIVLVGLLVVSISGKSIISSEQLERLNFVKPCDRFETTGYHVCNGYIAINNGGLFGVGLGNSTQKYSYLPEAHTDFIFAIVLEELGLVISLAILICFMVVLIRIAVITKTSSNLMESVICYGVFVYILFHIVINLTGLLGLLPLTGVPLPFFSYGGSYVLNLWIALGLVQRVHIESYNNKTKIKGIR